MSGGQPEIITPDWPLPEGVRSAITTRIGGVSQPPFDSFNIAAHVDDDMAAVKKNRQLLVDAMLLRQEPQWLEQVHGTVIVNAQPDGVVRTADGSYSRRVNVACLVQTADCLPILLCNKEGTEVAAVHAGWRGLAAGIVGQAVACFSSTKLMAYLGPAISQQHFEVGVDVYQAFMALLESKVGKLPVRQCFEQISDQHWQADLYGLARLALKGKGVSEIYGGNYCTYADHERFYSYRRDGVTGRMASLIWLTEIK